MSRLVSFLSALWLSSAAANPAGLGDIFNTVKTGATNELQAGLNPVAQSIAFIGGKLCGGVKPLARVDYKNYENNEPDMSQLTLIYMTSGKTVIYNLTQAATLLPKEEWFRPECRLLVYLHGFTDNPQKESFQTIRLAVEASEGDCVDILALDASSLIKWFYLRASTFVTFIGRALGAVLAAMTSAGLDHSKIHLIGHSLGSHIAGSTGKQFFLETGDKVASITSLDPAGPCFGDVPPELRLTKDDAKFVLVIHTDAGVYGLNEKVGHVDFWPNLGMEQPGCLIQTCSHSRAWEFHSESITNPTAFIGVKCDNATTFRQGKCDTSDTSIMGYFTPVNVTGDYYLVTKSESPFGAGEMGIKYEARSIIRTFSNGFNDFILH